jgi:hypothetical protein
MAGKKGSMKIWQRLFCGRKSARTPRRQSASRQARPGPIQLLSGDGRSPKGKVVEMSAHQIGSDIPLYAMDFCGQAREFAAS